MFGLMASPCWSNSKRAGSLFPGRRPCPANARHRRSLGLQSAGLHKWISPARAGPVDGAPRLGSIGIGVSRHDFPAFASRFGVAAYAGVWDTMEWPPAFGFACMYLPAQFESHDPHMARQIMRDHPFASLISVDEDACPFVTHLPLHWEAGAGDHGVLLGHCAMGNPHWKFLRERPQAVVTFMGPSPFGMNCYLHL